ncbi:hypothetical protein IFU37_014975 [Pantoea agglomerans]|uniref:hypothetical protein n=1 Tax=Enterobacter agglomerans TaxID=549 RepID=UPI00177BFFA5|nr:hypothetical protein [Pantoea agglomerans]WVL88908.1 hypothetical protein IFU37_014975 [Pantoea agglomerans]
MSFGWGNNDNRRAMLFENYGFRRHELAEFFESEAINLDIPLNEIKKSLQAEFEESNCLEEPVLLDKLKTENEILKRQVSSLRGNVPPLLAKYREDDPLLIAIQLRNDEWLMYNEDDRKTIPSQEGLVAQLKSQYSEFGMTDVQAKAIEKVACPIKRK